ncbi:MAG TPA: hypothetical protein VMR20_02470 [Verrucomicrobiae bacterium]|nr:hypothetical protein [Verrucomicrobiae bacterium]
MCQSTTAQACRLRAADSVPDAAAPCTRMQDRPSIKPLLACEKKVNEGFAETAALAARFHPQIAWAKFRALGDGGAFASKKLWS